MFRKNIIDRHSVFFDLIGPVDMGKPNVMVLFMPLNLEIGLLLILARPVITNSIRVC